MASSTYLGDCQCGAVRSALVITVTLIFTGCTHSPTTPEAGFWHPPADKSLSVIGPGTVETSGVDELFGVHNALLLTRSATPTMQLRWQDARLVVGTLTKEEHVLKLSRYPHLEGASPRLDLCLRRRWGMFRS